MLLGNCLGGDLAARTIKWQRPGVPPDLSPHATLSFLGRGQDLCASRQIQCIGFALSVWMHIKCWI